MKFKKTLTIMAAAMLLGLQVNGGAAASAISSADLTLINAFIDNGQVAELQDFLLAHPELMEGDSAFAGELRAFVESVRNGGVFAFSGALLSSLEAALGAAATTGSGERTTLY